jgi:hypothetical protein
MVLIVLSGEKTKKLQYKLRIKMKSLIFTLCLLLTYSSAFAVDSNGNYAVWGVGKTSCYGFNQKMKGEEAANNFKHYIKGFLTAYNMITDKTFSITGNMNESDIIEWLTEYCSENPMFGLETALINFTFDHYDRRMKSSGTAAGR